MTDLVMKQVAPGVPIWNIFYGDNDVGCMTVFPGEGIIATVTGNGVKFTVYGASKEECLANAQSIVDALDLQHSYEVNEDYIEDEDGSIAFARMLERNAESKFPDDDMPW